MSVKLEIKPLTKEKFGFGAAYSAKIITDFLGRELELSDIIATLDNEEMITAEEFTKLTKLGLKIKFLRNKDELTRTINERPVIYCNKTNRTCGIIYGYDNRNYFIFDLKSNKKVKQEVLERAIEYVIAIQ